MPKVTGYFSFNLTANGNLLGEFSNSGCTENFTEAANRNPPACVGSSDLASKFCGSYITTWCESPRVAFLAELEITHKTGCTGKFSLKWMKLLKNGEHDSCVFSGEAMLSGAMLTGNYWEV